MELSKFSKQFRVLGGCVLLTLAYAPMLLNLSSENEVFVDGGDALFVKNESILDGKPLVQTALTDSLSSEYLEEVKSSNFNVSDIDTKLVATNTEKSAKSQPAEPLKFKNIESGPYKGGRLIKGTIRSSFYVDARKLSVPVKVIDKVIHSLSSKIDFRRSLRRGDQFEIAFNAKNDLVYSKIKTRRNQASVYKFGKEGYFFENGEKVGGGASSGSFAPPIKGGLRVTSPFGLRIHPVTKKYKRHSGVDLVAKHGTPVYAIYDGVVTRASRYSGYGRCVDIKHKNGYSSRYGHLSRFTVRPGAKVKKGQLIAFSGASGVATGPHLHLELARNSVRLNPLRVKMMEEKPKRVSNKKQFNSLRNYFARLSNTIK